MNKHGYDLTTVITYKFAVKYGIFETLLSVGFLTAIEGVSQ